MTSPDFNDIQRYQSLSLKVREALPTKKRDKSSPLTMTMTPNRQSSKCRRHIFFRRVEITEKKGDTQKRDPHLLLSDIVFQSSWWKKPRLPLSRTVSGDQSTRDRRTFIAILTLVIILHENSVGVLDVHAVTIQMENISNQLGLISTRWSRGESKRTITVN